MAEKIKKFLQGFKLWRSLKVRLFVIIFLIGVIPGIIVRMGIMENYEDRAIEVRISDVQTQMKIIADHLITYNYLRDPSSEVINAELEQLANLYNGRLLVINGNLKVVKDTYGISEGKTIISEEVIQCMKGINTANHDAVNGFIEITIPIVETVQAEKISGKVQEEGETDTPPGTEIVRGVMLISVSTDTIAATLEILSRKSLIIESILIFCIFALSILLAQLLTWPFDKVSHAIREVKEGYTNEPIRVTDYLETESITDAFNSLLERMTILDESRKEFVANVSHELKTPMTSVKVLADSLLAQQDVPAELYREFMVDIAAEIEREDKIINDLLALVKLDKSAAQMNISVVNINQLTEIILKRLRPIARKSNVEVTLISKREVTAEVDEVKMSLVLTNLVENAIKYNKEQGKVEVLVDADHQFFTIQVSDTGIGIPKESMGQIYERFYRVDKSHSREIGGTGLGLAITRSAVLLHRGSIRLDSTEGEGTTFTVKIPLTRVQT